MRTPQWGATVDAVASDRALEPGADARIPHQESERQDMRYQRGHAVLGASALAMAVALAGATPVQATGVRPMKTAAEDTAVRDVRLSGNRIGVLTTDGVARVKEGNLSASWTVEDTHVQQVVLWGDRIGVVTSGGVAKVKEGSLDAPWVTMFTGVRQLALAGERVGVLTNDGLVRVKDGALNAGWTVEYSGADKLTMSGNRIGLILQGGTDVLVKDGGLNARWVAQGAPAAIELVMSGDRIGVRSRTGLMVKEGPLDAPWRTDYEIFHETGFFTLSGQRMAMVSAKDGTLSVREGAFDAPSRRDGNFDTALVVMSGDRIGIIEYGKAYVQAGSVDSPWVREF